MNVWAIIPEHLRSRLLMLKQVGSHSYGVATPMSDQDYVGVVLPPPKEFCPHLFKTYVPDFTPPLHYFAQWHTPEGSEIDVTLYSVAKFFRLCAQCNPNIVDILFSEDVPLETEPLFLCGGREIEANRSMFLHRGLYERFIGYAYSQASQIFRRNYTGKRVRDIEKYGYDVKAAYHCVRLLLEGEALLRTGTMDLKANAATLMKIRTGEWSFDTWDSYVKQMFATLKDLRTESILPEQEQTEAVQQLFAGRKERIA